MLRRLYRKLLGLSLLNQMLIALMLVPFPAQNIDLQTSTEVCKSLKNAEASFFVPAKFTENHRRPAFLRPELKKGRAGGAIYVKR
jgi:hypothetical protein